MRIKFTVVPSHPGYPSGLEASLDHRRKGSPTWLCSECPGYSREAVHPVLALESPSESKANIARLCAGKEAVGLCVLQPGMPWKLEQEWVQLLTSAVHSSKLPLGTWGQEKRLPCIGGV